MEKKLHQKTIIAIDTKSQVIIVHRVVKGGLSRT
jgi:hypothetical protein